MAHVCGNTHYLKKATVSVLLENVKRLPVNEEKNSGELAATIDLMVHHSVTDLVIFERKLSIFLLSSKYFRGNNG